jgi:hypothetical protein
MSNRLAGLVATVLAVPFFIAITLGTSSSVFSQATPPSGAASPALPPVAPEDAGIRSSPASPSPVAVPPAAPSPSPAAPSPASPSTASPSPSPAFRLPTEVSMRDGASPAAPAPAQALKTNEIAIYYTSNIIGYIDPCG